MDIYWYGQSCFKIKGKTTSVIIDPYDPEFVGLKLPKDMEAQVVLSTHSHKDHANINAVSGKPLAIAGPGEYEVSGVSVTGVSTDHDAAGGSERGRNTLYHVMIDGINIVHVGDLGHVLTEEQVSEIDNVDILMVPVGGTFTIDGETAAKVVAQLEPKIVIPMHYKIPGLSIEIEDVEPFLKEMGAESAQPQPKLTITKDKLPEEPQTVVLNKS